MESLCSQLMKYAMPTSTDRRLALGLLILALLWSLPALAQIQHLGEFRDWDAYALQEDSEQICYMLSIPKDMEPKNVRRGEVYFLVTHRPGDNVRNEISIITGYTYEPSSTVSAEIVGGNRYQLFTKDDGAWLRDTADEGRMVNAMRRGERMVVTGLSNRGTRTVDSYSLYGFTAAHNTISERCGR